MEARVCVGFLLLLAGCAGNPVSSPYAGEEGRGIKALSSREVADLLDGAGMGYAKAAELNRYPGPAHALELSDALSLSAAQRSAIGEILLDHKAEARNLGAEVIRLETQLDRLFAVQEASEEKVDAVTHQLGAASARLRASHLKAHIATTDLLSPRQVERYVELRGYGAAHRH